MKSKLYTLLLLSFLCLSLNAQTTVNLADQCDCEVYKSASEVTAGATSPTGADTGDLLTDPSGDIFYWDGNSWEHSTAQSNSLFLINESGTTTFDTSTTINSSSSVNYFPPSFTISETTNAMISLDAYFDTIRKGNGSSFTTGDSSEASKAYTAAIRYSTDGGATYSTFTRYTGSYNSASGNVSFLTINGTFLTQLAPGTYQVRVDFYIQGDMSFKIGSSTINSFKVLKL